MILRKRCWKKKQTDSSDYSDDNKNYNLRAGLIITLLEEIK